MIADLAYGLLQILYVCIPTIMAGTLHMAIVTFDLLASLRTPLDGNRTFRGRRILGDNKTVRGITVMPAITALFFWAQALAYHHCAWARELSFFDYTFTGSAWHPVTAGVVVGLGYAVAELPNSFIKRQLDVPPGAAGRGLGRTIAGIVDQADSAVGCVLAMYLFWRWPLSLGIALILVGTGIHLFVNMTLYLMTLRNRPV